MRNVWVVELSQYVYFILKAFLTVYRFESRLFLESLNCETFIINSSLCQVYTCEISFAYLLNTLIKLMESSAFHNFYQHILPVIKIHKREKFDRFRAVYGKHPSITISADIIAQVKTENIGALDSLVGIAK